MNLLRLLRDADYRRWAALWWRHRRTPRYRPGSLQGFGFDLQVGDHLSVVHQLHDIFVQHEYRIPDPGPRPVIVDVGANVGVSVLYHCRTLDDPEIHAYEADPAIFACLQHNVQRHAPQARVWLHHAAAYVADGHVRFASEGADGGQVDAGGGSATVEVPSVDLLRVLQRLPRVDLLKIDIEGAEALVVPHIAPALGHVARVFIEVHSTPGQPQVLPQLLELLQRVGFRLHLQSAEVVRSPFVPAPRHFDNQLNVFAYRDAAVGTAR